MMALHLHVLQAWIQLLQIEHHEHVIISFLLMMFDSSIKHNKLEINQFTLSVEEKAGNNELKRLSPQFDNHLMFVGSMTQIPILEECCGTWYLGISDHSGCYFVLNYYFLLYNHLQETSTTLYKTAFVKSTTKASNLNLSGLTPSLSQTVSTNFQPPCFLCILQIYASIL